MDPEIYFTNLLDVLHNFWPNFQFGRGVTAEAQSNASGALEYHRCWLQGPHRPPKVVPPHQNGLYSRYPEVHMTKTMKLLELKTVLNKTIWTKSGVTGEPHTVYQVGQGLWSKTWKMTPHHLPVNTTMELFNQSMKLTILAAYTKG